MTLLHGGGGAFGGANESGRIGIEEVGTRKLKLQQKLAQMAGRCRLTLG